MMRTYKMTIAYDGTHYSGWQVQIPKLIQGLGILQGGCDKFFPGTSDHCACTRRERRKKFDRNADAAKNQTLNQFRYNGISIQSLIQDALSTLLRKKVSLIASGRTDAGVHALEQVAHFKYDEKLKLSQILYSLNALLPADIRILSLQEAPSTFHARFSAVSKIYHYYLHIGPVLDPFEKLYSYHLPQGIDLPLLTQATTYFVGTHDFTSFTNKGSSTHTNIRTIHSLKVLHEKEKVCLIFEGNGFGYKGIRNIVGALLDVCAGRMALNDIPVIFAARDRRKAGIAAPARGLFLVKVNY